MNQYNYEIVSTDEASKTMLISYTAEGCAKHVISARLPMSEETVEDVVKIYAPIGTWIEENAERKSVTVGEAGQIAIEETNPTYQDFRRSDYPNIYDYIDGVVKGDQEQIDTYIAECKAVKERHPKP